MARLRSLNSAMSMIVMRPLSKFNGLVLGSFRSGDGRNRSCLSQTDEGGPNIRLLQPGHVRGGLSRSRGTRFV